MPGGGREGAGAGMRCCCCSAAALLLQRFSGSSRCCWMHKNAAEEPCPGPVCRSLLGETQSILGFMGLCFNPVPACLPSAQPSLAAFVCLSRPQSQPQSPRAGFLPSPRAPCGILQLSPQVESPWGLGHVPPPSSLHKNSGAESPGRGRLCLSPRRKSCPSCT